MQGLCSHLALTSGHGEDNAQSAVKYAAFLCCYLKPFWHLVCKIQIAEDISYLVSDHPHKLTLHCTACMQGHPHEHK